MEVETGIEVRDFAVYTNLHALRTQVSVDRLHTLYWQISRVCCRIAMSAAASTRCVICLSHSYHSNIHGPAQTLATGHIPATRIQLLRCYGIILASI